MRARRDAALRLLKTMLVASIVIPVALFSYAAWFNYHNALAHADEQLTASLNILSEHASKVFQSVDLTFTSVDTIIGGDPTDEQIKAKEEPLHFQLSKLEKALATVDAIFIADKDGRALVSSAIFPLPADTSVADRDYFQAQAPRNSGTYIGAVSQSRATKARIFGVSRRRPAVDGQFNGIIVVSVLPAAFTEFYKKLAVSRWRRATARFSRAIPPRREMPRISARIAASCALSPIVRRVGS
jgi:two-component system, NtrC family, sensor kinase